jgi:hypothetical protein
MKAVHLFKVVDVDPFNSDTASAAAAAAFSSDVAPLRRSVATTFQWLAANNFVNAKPSPRDAPTSKICRSAAVASCEISIITALVAI